MSKCMISILMLLVMTGCNRESNKVENLTVEDNNLNQTEDWDSEIEEEEPLVKKQEEVKVDADSIYLEDFNRGEVDNGEYLMLGESMEFYLEGVSGETFPYYHIKPIHYLTKLEKDNHYDGDQWYENIHFIFEVTESENRVDAYEREDVINNFKELIDAKLFIDDINLGKYFYGTFLQDGSNFKKVARFENLIRVNGEEIYSCYAPGTSGLNEETGIRTCVLSFSYNGPGEYLLAMSDGAGEFKNYLIEVE